MTLIWKVWNESFILVLWRVVLIMACIRHWLCSAISALFSKELYTTYKGIVPRIYWLQLYKLDFLLHLCLITKPNYFINNNPFFFFQVISWCTIGSKSATTYKSFRGFIQMSHYTKNRWLWAGYNGRSKKWV